ncbi:MAG: hypothetical protein AAF387_19415 [Pseudomonadota bacterium]
MGKKEAPDYNWVCHVCDTVVPAGTLICISCGNEAGATKESVAFETNPIFIEENSKARFKLVISMLLVAPQLMLLMIATGQKFTAVAAFIVMIVVCFTERKGVRSAFSEPILKKNFISCIGIYVAGWLLFLVGFWRFTPFIALLATVVIFRYYYKSDEANIAHEKFKLMG